MRGRILLVCVCECPDDVLAPFRKFQKLAGFPRLLVLINVVETKDLDVASQPAESVEEGGRRCGCRSSGVLVRLARGKPALRVVLVAIQRALWLRNIPSAKHNLVVLELAVGVDEAETKGKTEVGEEALEGREQLLPTHEALVCFLEGRQGVVECSNVRHD